MTTNQMKLWIYLTAFSVLLWNVNSQCQTRNQTAADLVGRPCRKPCTIGSNDCRDGKICRCDHECGYSCINLGNFCRPPPIINNFAQLRLLRRLDNGTLARVQPQQFIHNDIAEYVCRPGFTSPSTSNYNYCHGRKGWTRSAECILSCSRYDAVQVLSNRMVCGSNCTSDADCRNTFECRCDGACGKTCVSRDASCENLSPPSNGRIEYSGEGIDRRAKYICNEGYYRRSGSSSRRCTGGGSWEGRPAICRRIICSDPQLSFNQTGGRITNYQSPPFYVGRALQFACSASHRLLGSQNRTCQANGQWSGMPSVCDIKDNLTRCSHPGIPINGKLNMTSDFSIGSLVKFECNRGYVMIGDSEQECLFFLQWSGNGAPQCIDPKLPSSFQRGLRNLEASIEDSIIDAKRSVSGGSSARAIEDTDQNVEIIFAVDVSRGVSLDELEESLAFAQEHVEKITVGGRIKCAVILFASKVDVHLELQACDVQTFNETIEFILRDRANINNRVGNGRNTAAVLSTITQVFTRSFVAKGESNRNVFLFVNGLHDEGEPPINVIQRLKLVLILNAPVVNVIAFGDEATSVEAVEELRALAIPVDRFSVNPQLASRPSLETEEMDKCGIAGDIGSINGRLRVRNVFGGDMAKVGAWPWHAVVSELRNTIRSSYRSVRGGGSLINRRWVLTAAHLFDDISRSAGWERHFLVTLGITSLPQIFGTSLPASAQAFQAARITLHASYDQDTLDFDIALIKIGQSYRPFGDSWLRVPSSITFTRHVKPVCLPCMENSCARAQLRKSVDFHETDSLVEKCRKEGEWLLQKDLQVEKNFLGVVIGFGATNQQNNALSSFLKQGRIRLLNNETCEVQRDALSDQLSRQNQQLDAFFTENMICGVGGTVQNITDACRGDSGGAFIRQVKDMETGDSCWVQIGIVSWGYGCGESFFHNGIQIRYPGYYTNVVAFVDWIKNETAECSVRNLNAIEPGRFCRKPCESDSDCKGQLKRCLCDDDCGLSCFNPEAECNDIDPLINGRIIGNRTYGNVVTYQCDVGYMLQGNPRRQCRSDRLWSGTAPTCAPTVVDCDSSPCLNGGDCVNNIGGYQCSCVDGYRGSNCEIEIRCEIADLSGLNLQPVGVESVFYNEVATYRCIDGYKVRRNAFSLSAQCTINGLFDEEPPTCERIHCMIPELTDGLSITPESRSTVRYNEVITFECIRGYVMEIQLENSLNATCLRNEEFSVEAPTCSKIECRIPASLEFGTITRLPGSVETRTGFLWFESQLRYECDDNYEMENQDSGMLTVTCLENGDWSDALPVCILVRCPNPESPEHGSVNTRDIEFTFGQVITYDCDQGYKIVGDSEGVCNAGGNWGQLPVCEIDDDCDFEVLQRRTCGYRTRGSPEWIRTVTSNVREGFRGFVVQATLDSRETGQRSVLYSPMIPRDTMMCLRFYFNVTRIRGRNNFAVMSVINNTPREVWSYDHREPRSQWLGTDILFESAYTPFQIEFAVMKDSSSSVMVEMDDISVHPSNESDCFDDCHSSPCLNGGDCVNRIGGYQCYCVDGYRGDNCEIESRCEIPDLSGLNLRPVGVESVFYNTIVTYRCIDGYKVRRNAFSSTAQCTINGLFDEDPPSCKRIHCTIPELTDGLSITPGNRNTVVYNQIITFSCSRGYVMDSRRENSLTATCLRNEEFSVEAPTCSRIECPVPDSLEFGTISRLPVSVETRRGFLWFGSQLRYKCNDNYEMENQDSGMLTVTCTANGDWSDPLPACVPIECVVPRPANGRVFSNGLREVVVGTRLVYRCNSGYSMEGSFEERITVTCRNNKRFSPALPDCLPIRCTPAEPNPHSQNTGSTGSVAVGDNVVYRCLNGYHIRGDPSSQTLTTTCEADNGRGMWSKAAPLCEGAWSEFDEWGDCSQTCGGGNRRRSRTCLVSPEGECDGSASQTESCNENPCPGEWDAWSEWSVCSLSCGGGTRRRDRSCQSDSRCQGLAEETEDCRTADCPSWEGWMAWGRCSQTCGGGFQRRVRECSGSNVNECDGESQESQSCNNDGCVKPEATSPEWGSWTEFGVCSRVCGGGIRRRSRECVGGVGCDGLETDSDFCNTRACSFDDTEFGPKKYRFYRHATNFVQAEAECSDYGGTLAIIKSREVNTALTDLIDIPRNQRRDIYVYIGMEGENTRDWFYADQTRVPLRGQTGYQRWTFGEPNNWRIMESCGCMTYSGFWNDISCIRNLFFICEKSAGCTLPDLQPFTSVLPTETTKFEVNETITYVCDSGYEISGTPETQLTATCLEDQSWTNDPPLCARINPCNRRPCRNGGSCEPNGGLNYLCLCPVETAGDQCEIITDLCISSPCQNGGTCAAGTRTSYRCDCTSQFIGDYCETSACRLHPDLIQRGVEISNRNSDEIYAQGVQLSISCTDPDGFLLAATTITTCMSGGRWLPSYTSFRCI